jgi:hypothetical protein
MKITSRMPRAEYDAIPALNISRLKEIKRSPQHYKYRLTHPRTTVPLIVGNACHVAVLEPERYADEFAVWNRTSESGNACPRKGQFWDAFKAQHAGRTILMPDEDRLAKSIAAAVRQDERAREYLSSGDPEVTLEWNLAAELGGRAAKSRVDWLTSIDGRPYLVGLKTSRNCAHYAFAAQAAKLGYHWAWAYYEDAYTAITGKRPCSIEIVVEVEPPHAVAVYRIPDDIIEQGREEYWEAAKLLAECEAKNEWPGPAPMIEDLTLPTWAYKHDDDDLSSLGLSMENAA